MKRKQLLHLLLVCAAVFCCAVTPAGAAQVPSENIIRLENMRYDLIEPSAITQDTDEASPLTTGSLNTTVPPFYSKAVGQISLQRGNVITFNCSYSPSSASVDFGVIAPNGRFYYINVKGGSINQAIRISQSGSYTVAIRNNSSQIVRVVGFVNY